jgi:hypothetical protein
MPRVVRLATLADVGGDAETGRISVTARHEAVLEDGRQLLLLDDRGWSEAIRGAGATEVSDIWAVTTELEIAQTARAVVGPDEPFGGRSQNDIETDHWNALADTLRAQGVAADAGELSQLPHVVVLSDDCSRASVEAWGRAPESPVSPRRSRARTAIRADRRGGMVGTSREDVSAPSRS